MKNKSTNFKDCCAGFTPLPIMAKKSSRYQLARGFTLLETLVSLAILGVITAGIYMVLNVGNRSYKSDMGLLDLQQEVRQAMSGMIRELKQSNSSTITISNAGARIDFKVPTDITTSPVTYSDFIAYYISNNQLLREHPAGTFRVLANDTSNLNFCWWDGVDCCDSTSEDCSSLKVVQIQLRAAKTVWGRNLCFPAPCDPQEFLSEEVWLRN